MSLTSGTKLGPYEILAAIGAGGMGEVYKARDTRLDRTVAIKVLPEHLASNGELLQRFEREARSISSLNHANICVLHDVGEQSGVHFLVMEYIEGESLSQRLARGPIATPELIRIGTQIADALDKAHRQGLVHRDLKPGNIMLTKSGAKLLDFGLAKARGALATSASGHDAALTQTKAASGPITEQGRVVGTFQYMSPEQVEGREADARSDIFAFGAVLYEMATGKRAFEGRSSISIASAILEKEPEPISSVQPMTPPGLEQVVRTCLAKDPEERWQSAADIGRQLRWVSESGSQAAATMLPAKVRRRRLERVAWASGVGLLLAVVGVLAWMSREPGTPLHAEFAATNGLTFDFMGDVAAPPALSPDGTMVVFGAHTDKEPQGLYVRSLRTGAVQRLAGTESGIFPFWSPDSKFIGFFGDGKIEKTAAAGGPVSIITATDTAPRGGCWTEGNEILFTPDYARPLFRVSASGGTPTELTKLAPNHTTHRWPVCLPDGKHFLYYATNHSSPAGEQNGIYFGAMGGKEDKFVVASDAAALYANGYLLYHQQNELIAQKFDAGTGTLSGDPRPLADLVTYDPGTWHLLMTVSANGELLYQRGVATAGGTQFEWADRSGKPLQQLGTPAGHNGFSISPDGKRVVTSIIGRLSDIYILDSQTGLATRLTFDPTNHVDPSWSPDGTKIVYADDQNLGSGPLAAALHVKAANGTGADQEVYRPAGGAAVWPQYTRDGQNIVFMYVNGPTGWQVETIPASGGKPAVVVKPQTPQANVSQFDVSPDEKWIAYSSNDTGTAQVYVSSFPSGSGRWQVSTNGGIETMWSRKSKELFFLGTDFNLYSAHYNDDGGQFAITAIQQVMAFHNVPPSGKSFEISPDGSKFLLDIASQQSSAPLTLVVNWPSDLKN